LTRVTRLKADESHSVQIQKWFEFADINGSAPVIHVPRTSSPYETNSEITRLDGFELSRGPFDSVAGNREVGAVSRNGLDSCAQDPGKTERIDSEFEVLPSSLQVRKEFFYPLDRASQLDQRFGEMRGHVTPQTRQMAHVPQELNLIPVTEIESQRRVHPLESVRRDASIEEVIEDEPDLPPAPDEAQVTGRLVHHLVQGLLVMVVAPRHDHAVVPPVRLIAAVDEMGRRLLEAGMLRVLRESDTRASDGRLYRAFRGLSPTMSASDSSTPSQRVRPRSPAMRSCIWFSTTIV